MTESNKKCDKKIFDVPIGLHRFGQHFRHPFPQMSRPECFGFFSVNGEREYQDNADNLSYLRIPSELPLDLNAGIESVLRKTWDPPYHDMNLLCKYIYHHQGELLKPFSGGKTGARRLDADFVTLRGLLRLIMCLPYEGQKDFRMHAVRMNNNIYMMKIETELQQKNRLEMTPHQRSMCSWGFKFEQYLTTSSPDSEPTTDVPVNECEEFIGMFKCQFAGMNLIFGAEMDCIKTSTAINLNDPKALTSVEFIELKTCALDMHSRQQRSFDLFKSHLWWSQSFLVGISSIYAGLRNSKGVTHEIKQYNVSDLARNKPWSPTAMVVFLKEFLKQLKHVMETINDEHVIVQIDYDPKDRFVFYKIIKDEQICKDILPDWYRLLLNEMPTKKIKH